MAYYPLVQTTGARYTLSSPTGVVAVFNDPTDPNYVGMLTEVTGLDSADVRETADELVQQDGGRHGDFWLGRRPITLTGSIFNHATEAERNIRMDRLARASNALRGDATLSWKPAWWTTNYVLNPGAETNVLNISGTANYLTTGSVITRTTAQAAEGSASAQIATSGSQHGASFTLGTALKANTSYSVSFKYKGAVGGESIDYYVGDASVGVYGVGEQNQVGTGTLTTSWQTVSFTFTPTVNVPNAGVVIRRTDGTASTFFVDAVVVSPYYVETFVPVRRQQPLRFSGGWTKQFQLQLVSEYATIFSSALRTPSQPVGAAVPVTLENRGSYDAFPIVRFTGPCVNPRWTNSTTGAVFYTTGLTLAADEVVEFDMFNHTGIFTAGTRNTQSANRYIDFITTTRWPTLQSGLNSVVFTRDSGTGTMYCVYRDTWA